MIRILKWHKFPIPKTKTLNPSWEAIISIDIPQANFRLLELCGNEQSLFSLRWRNVVNPIRGKNDAEFSPIFVTVLQELRAYFLGKLRSFSLPIHLSGTDKQKLVWAELSKIGYGETCCYQDIANCLNCPKSVRSVASAIGANPVSILVPCHRVLGKNGKLLGYSGGLEAKEFLLSLERQT